jgi:suppressor of ftsI
MFGKTIFRTLAAVLLPALPFAAMTGQTTPLPEPPQVRGRNHVVSLTIGAVIDANRKEAFSFQGRTEAPVIRVTPGDVLKITYVNNLPANSTEECAEGPCMDMSNLHFHGLQVSPNFPQDDVLTMLAMPGQTLEYAVQIPEDHPPGLYWYHPHPHGESHRQVLDGMSGAIVVEGMERYVPEVRGMRERILVLRGLSIDHNPEAASLTQRVEIPAERCGESHGKPEQIFTVNGAVRPQIDIAPGERQFWRMVNASSNRYMDLQIDGQPMEIVALDGVPLALHDPEHPVRTTNHFLLSPAGRIEAIVTGPPPGDHYALRSLCVNTGPDGDLNPGMVLADVVPGRAAQVPSSAVEGKPEPSPTKKVHKVDVEAMEHSKPDFVVTFTEDKNGFYINGQKFSPDAEPMVTVRIGSYQHWRIVNATAELHPFHLHQTHFLAYAENDVRLKNPQWLDTVNVPYKGTVDIIADFTNPVIKGVSLFHCHLLNHEDKGMMAKILFVDK